MPKKFEDIKNEIEKSLKGKLNPRTNKPYTSDDIWAISVNAYKKKYGHAPSKESSPEWYFDNGKEVRENVNLKWSEVIEFDKNQKISLDQPLIIHGRAINETITKNNIKYVKEELEKAAPTLVGKPLLNSHNHDDVKGTLGKVRSAEKVTGGIDYVAEIDPEERVVINKVKRGYIDKVSIYGNVNKLIKEDIEEGGETKTVYVAEGLNFGELSLVTVPGDENSSINVAIGESFNINSPAELEIDSAERVEENKKGEIDMAEIANDKVSLLEKERSELLQKLSILEAEKKAKEDAEKMDKMVAEKVALEVAKVEEKFKKKEEAKKEESKPEEKKASESDNTKGIVLESKPKTSSIQDMDRIVLEKVQGGLNFYMLPKNEYKVN